MVEMREMQLGLPTPRQLFTPGVTGVLILCVIGYVLCAFAPASVSALGLSVQALTRFKIWQFLTYPFLHGCPWNLIFNGMVILFIGSAIEREWRTGAFITLWLVVSIDCGILWVLANLVTGNQYIGIGATACCYGIIATMGVLFYGTRFFVFFTTVEAQYLALIVIGIGVVLNIKPPIRLVWVLGALIAYIYVKMRTSRGPRRSFGSGPSPRTQGHRGGFVDID